MCILSHAAHLHHSWDSAISATSFMSCFLSVLPHLVLPIAKLLLTHHYPARSFLTDISLVECFALTWEPFAEAMRLPSCNMQVSFQLGARRSRCFDNNVTRNDSSGSPLLAVEPSRLPRDRCRAKLLSRSSRVYVLTIYICNTICFYRGYSDNL